MNATRIFGMILLPLLLASCDTGNFSSAKPSSPTALETILSSEKKADSKSVAVSSEPEENDDGVCTAKGLKPEEEKYYQCRAQLMRDRIAANESVLKKLTPAQREQYASWQQQAQDFETKAKEAHKTQVNTMRTARKKWEEEQAEIVRIAEPKDHQACIRKGFSLGKMENPKTEGYFDCRAVLAAQHITPPPPEAQYNANQLPKAVLTFYRQAEESQQAFNARDYQDHYACLDKGLFPGEWEDPNTSEYYRCRAALAGEGLGKDIKALFLEDVSRAKKEAEEHRVCTLRHYTKGMPEYAVCRKAYVAYKLCKDGIRSQVAAREARDRRDCNQKANLEYPSHLAQDRITEFTKVNAGDKEIRSKKVEPAKYTLQELNNVRSSTASMCMHDKEVTRVQYRLQLEYQCEQIMDNIGQQGGQYSNDQ